MRLRDVVCGLCGGELALTEGVDSDGVRWARHRCRCGSTDILHIDKGKLDLDELRRSHGEPSDDFELFPSAS